MTTQPDRTDHVRAKQAAAAMWPKLSEDEKALVRFGMLPQWAAEEAERDYGKDAAGTPYRDFGRLFAVALMDETKAVGGMIA